jgi:hypothetical protein
MSAFFVKCDYGFSSLAADFNQKEIAFNER